MKKEKQKKEENQEIENKEISIKDLILAVEEEKERRLRVMADLENYKKRTESEKAMFGAIANRGLIQEILEVNDDLSLALDDTDLDLNRAKSSIESAKEKIRGLVKNAGVEQIEINKGDQFNSETMEAIQAVPDKENAGKVIAVISSAYKYVGQDTILKHAKVIVGK